MLNTTIQINNMQLKNRLVMPPMATAKATADGAVTAQICDYYKEKTSGGYIGLIIVEHSYVNLEGKAGNGQLSIADDEKIDGLLQLTDTIHQNGSKVMAQISHAGGAAKTEITGRPVWGASAAPMPKTGNVPTELSVAGIHKVIDDFSAAAVRAKRAGFDGVELHCAHGYLLNQFYSPLTNKRTDLYGGETLDGRLKLHLEMIQAVRSAVGTDFPIAVRLGACDYMDGGSTIRDSVYAAKRFEEAGIDLLDISGGFCGYIRPGAKEQGYFSEITQAIKEAADLPVLLTGGITEAQTAEQLLESGKADLIGVGRSILRDSLWAGNAIRSLSHR